MRRSTRLSRLFVTIVSTCAFLELNIASDSSTESTFVTNCIRTESFSSIESWLIEHSVMRVGWIIVATFLMYIETIPSSTFVHVDSEMFATSKFMHSTPIFSENQPIFVEERIKFRKGPPWKIHTRKEKSCLIAVHDGEFLTTKKEFWKTSWKSEISLK